MATSRYESFICDLSITSNFKYNGDGFGHSDYAASFLPPIIISMKRHFN